MTETLQIEGLDIEHTSTVALARELYKASWKWNVGRTVYDSPLWEGLSEVDKFHLIEVAGTAEVLLDKFGNEDEKLVLYNLARTLYLAYHLHPVSTVPEMSFDTAPDEVRNLWIRYARQVWDEYLLKKHLPRHKPWLDVVVR